MERAAALERDVHSERGRIAAAELSGAHALAACESRWQAVVQQHRAAAEHERDAAEDDARAARDRHRSELEALSALLDQQRVAHEEVTMRAHSLSVQCESRITVDEVGARVAAAEADARQAEANAWSARLDDEVAQARLLAADAERQRALVEIQAQLDVQRDEWVARERIAGERHAAHVLELTQRIGADAGERVRLAEQRCDALERDLTAARADADARAAELQRAQLDAGQTKYEIARVRAEQQVARVDCDKAIAAADAARRDAQLLDERVSALVAQLTAAQASSASAQDQQASAKGALSSAQAELDGVRVQLANANERLRAAETSVRQLEAAAAAAESERAALVLRVLSDAEQEKV